MMIAVHEVRVFLQIWSAAADSGNDPQAAGRCSPPTNQP
jgi:hypothetical protein